MTSDLEFKEVDIPTDTGFTGDSGEKPYNPEYPDSTPEAPYGYFPDGRPRKRRPKGTAKNASKRSAASESQARAAAGMLAKVNSLVGTSLMLFGMPMTATQIENANEQFEVFAYEALLSDPALCRKILSAGANSGKAGLAMAYAMLGLSVAPTAFMEIKARREIVQNEADTFTEAGE